MRRLGHIVLILLLSCCLLLAGCKSTGDKQVAGTAIGAVAGGLVGSLFGSGSGKVVAIGIGALAGAAIGNYVGSILDEQDQAAVAAQSAHALSQKGDGEASQWKNPETGASATITVDQTETVTRPVPIVREKYVASPGELILIGEKYLALKTSNVRAGPGTDYKVVNGLKKGEPVQVVGQVKGKSWYMIGRKGRSIGYVHTKLLVRADAATLASACPPPASTDQTVGQGVNQTQADAAQPDAAQPDAAAQTQEQAATQTAGADYASGATVQESVLRTEAMSLDDIEASMNLEEEGLVVEEVQAETEVRTVTVTAENAEGQTETNTFRASKAGDGAWEVI